LFKTSDDAGGLLEARPQHFAFPAELLVVRQLDKVPDEASDRHKPGKQVSASVQNLVLARQFCSPSFQVYTGKVSTVILFVKGPGHASNQTSAL
jgi:hypothetical protein